MVYETEERPNSYMERSSPSIFGAIQIHVGDNPGSINLSKYEKGPDEDYKEYGVRWKNAASMVRSSLTSREENSMFMDTLPFPYYDMLIVNTFVEFGDLMYSVGRIKDGIKRGRIVDTGASMREKKRIIPDEHVQVMSRERRSKRKSHMA